MQRGDGHMKRLQGWFCVVIDRTNPVFFQAYFSTINCITLPIHRALDGNTDCVSLSNINLHGFAINGMIK